MSRSAIALTGVFAAVIGVGVALAGLIVTSNNSLRADFRAEIQAVRTEVQALREETRTAREALRAEARAEREALRAEARADREAFQAEMRMLRVDSGDSREAISRLTGIVEEMRTVRR